MPEWLVVTLAGGAGGMANSYISQGGFALPILFSDARGRRVLDPGVLGSIFIGMIAGIALWAFNNPSASFADTDINPGPVVGALIAGVGGGRFLSSLVERSQLETKLSRTTEALQNVVAATLLADEQDESPTEGGKTKEGRDDKSKLPGKNNPEENQCACRAAHESQEPARWPP